MVVLSVSLRSYLLVIFSSHFVREWNRPSESYKLRGVIKDLEQEIHSLKDNTEVFESCSAKSFWLIWVLKLSLVLHLLTLAWVFYSFRFNRHTSATSRLEIAPEVPQLELQSQPHHLVSQAQELKIFPNDSFAENQLKDLSLKIPGTIATPSSKGKVRKPLK